MLAVAHNRQNLALLKETFEAEGVSVRTAATPEEMARFPDPDEEIHVALVDVDGFGEEVWDLCERLSDAGVPVIVVAKIRDDRVQRESIKRGVSTVVEKPLRKANLRAMLHTHFRHDRHADQSVDA